MNSTDLLQFVDNLQAGKIHNLQQVCGVFNCIINPNIIYQLQPQAYYIYSHHRLGPGGGGGGGGGGALEGPPPLTGAGGGGGGTNPPAEDVEAMPRLGSNIESEGAGRFPGGMSGAREQELSFPGETDFVLDFGSFLCLKRAIFLGSVRFCAAG